MREKYKTEKKITPLYTLNLEVILHYMTPTSYVIVNDIEMTRNHININMGGKCKKENTNNSIIYTKCRSYITLYNTYSLYIIL